MWKTGRLISLRVAGGYERSSVSKAGLLAVIALLMNDSTKRRLQCDLFRFIRGWFSFSLDCVVYEK